jgi:hypothetical protein
MPDARRIAQRIISSLTDDERKALADEPFSGLNDLGFDIRMRPEPEIISECSVAGSFDGGPPPVITVVRATSTGRQYFSALHEFGHWAIKRDTEIHDVFFREADGGVRLEEDTCDAIAGELLIPADRVDEHIGANGPTARGVLTLIRATPNSSREACCVRAAERLSGPGHVMVARDGIAQFTASHSTPYWVKRGTAQGENHITVKAHRRGSCQEESAVTYAGGSPSGLYFADAVRDDEDGFVVAVFMENRPPWIKGLALPSKDRSSAAETDTYCTHCEVDFTGIGRPCPKCDGYFHYGNDGCGKCACKPVTGDKVCDDCFLRRPPTDFTKSETTCDICLGG